MRLFKLLFGKKTKPTKIISAVFIGNNGYSDIIQVTYSDGIIEKYVGDCTVWQKLPHFERVPSFTSIKEGVRISCQDLYQIQKYLKFWNAEYPDGHLKTQTNEKYYR